MDARLISLTIIAATIGCADAPSSSSEAEVKECTSCIRWVHEFGPDSLTSPLVSALAAGNKGTFVIGGRTSGEEDDFGCGAVQTTDHAAFVARFTSSGECAWHHELLPTGQPDWSSRAETKAIGVDAEGRVIIAADVNYNVDAGNGELPPAGSDPDAAELLLAQYDSKGKLRWAKRFGAKTTQGSPRLTPTALAIGADGDIFVAGLHAWAASFDDHDLPSDGSAFVARFSADGDVRWAKEAGSEVRITALTVTEDDRVVAVGTVGDYGVVGGSGSHSVFGKTIEVPAGADANLLVASLTATGKASWVTGFSAIEPHVTPSPGADGKTVAVDADGSIVVGGTLSGRITIGDEELAPAEEEGYASYVARFGSDGTPIGGFALQDRSEVRLASDGDGVRAVSGSEDSGLFIGRLSESGLGQEKSAKSAHTTVQELSATSNGSLLMLVAVGTKGGKAFGRTLHRGQAALIYRP